MYKKRVCILYHLKLKAINIIVLLSKWAQSFLVQKRDHHGVNTPHVFHAQQLWSSSEKQTPYICLQSKSKT